MTKLPAMIPTLPEVVREGLIVLGGALLAALIIGRIPALRDFIQSNWWPNEAPPPK